MNDDEVGSVGEEAAKLLGALSDWARDQGQEQAGQAAGAAHGMAAAASAVNEHIATGADSCRFCPVCQAISLVRDTSPEVKQHLAVAASSLMHAAAGLLATHVPPDRAPGREAGVEKIDLTDDWTDDDTDRGSDD